MVEYRKYMVFVCATKIVKPFAIIATVCIFTKVRWYKELVI